MRGKNRNGKANQTKSKQKQHPNRGLRGALSPAEASAIASTLIVDDKFADLRRVLVASILAASWNLRTFLREKKPVWKETHKETDSAVRQKITTAKNITAIEYTGLQQAYDFINVRLFNAALPASLLTFQRRRRARAYFKAKRFRERSANETRAHEIAMNPDAFVGRSDREILSTLTHEMCHLWRETFTKPSSDGYHDRKWARKMIDVGLLPTNTGKPGGKQTGYSVTHCILPNGPFAAAYEELAASGFCLHWESGTPPSEGIHVKKRRASKLASKTKFVCPDCPKLHIAWAKPNSSLICGHCEAKMEAEPANDDVLFHKGGF